MAKRARLVANDVGGGSGGSPTDPIFNTLTVNNGTNLNGSLTVAGASLVSALTSTVSVTAPVLSSSGTLSVVGNSTLGTVTSTDLAATGNITTSTGNVVATVGNVTAGGALNGNSAVITNNAQAGSLTSLSSINGVSSTLSGAINADSGMITNVLTTGTLSTGVLTLSGTLNAASAVLTGLMMSATATVTGLLTAGTATITGLLSGATAIFTGTVQVNDLDVTTNVDAATGTFTGALNADSLLTTNNVVAAGFSTTGVIAGDTLNLAGLATINDILCDDITATGAISGVGLSSSTTATITGALTAASANLSSGTGFVTCGQVTATGVTATGIIESTGSDLIANNDVTANNDANITRAVNLTATGTAPGVQVGRFYMDNGANTFTGQQGLRLGVDFGGDVYRDIPWYQSGNWTPNVEIGATDVAETTANGKYILIGRLMHVSCRVVFNSGVLAGDVLILGLPFTTASNQRHGLTIAQSVRTVLSAGGRWLGARVLEGATQIEILENRSNDVAVRITGGNYVNGTIIEYLIAGTMEIA